MSSTSFFMSNETQAEKNAKKYDKGERNRLLFPGVKYRSTQQNSKITEV